MTKKYKKGRDESVTNKQKIQELISSNRLIEAKNLCEQYCQRFPNDQNGLRLMGSIYARLDQFAEAEQVTRRLIEFQPNDARAYYNLGVALQLQNQVEAAKSIYETVLKLQPGHKQARINLNNLSANSVPRWHFSMLNDTVRNDAYDRAIRRAIRPDDVVLDIGSGSGLLAMMAARAGAKHIISCEAIPPIAEIAREIVRQNGFEDRITIIAQNSTKLEVGKDLPQPATLLISEIVDCGLLGERVVPTTEHARANLLTPDARMIPCGASVFAILIECEELFKGNYVTMVSGFDVNKFNFFSSERYQPLKLNNYPHRRLTEVFPVFDFNFTNNSIHPNKKRLHVTAITGGFCHALAFWFRLDLIDEISLLTAPDVENHWIQAIQVFKEPLALEADATVNIDVQHTYKYIQFSSPQITE